MQTNAPQPTAMLVNQTLFEQLSSAMEQAKNRKATLMFNVSNDKEHPEEVNP